MYAQQGFQQQPQAVGSARNRYRPMSGVLGATTKPRNLMNDKRIVRGNTYAAQIPTMEQARREQMEQDSRRIKRIARNTRVQVFQEEQQHEVVVEGRESVPVQTDDYLEELVDKVFEKHIDTQTDEFEDKQVAPVFVPKKMGISQETSIAPGDLFDFELAVGPVLETLVGKQLDMGLMEVLEEEEWKTLRAHRQEFLKRRNGAIAESQRLEAEALRRYEEKNRRVAQQRERASDESAVAHKVAARKATLKYLAGLNNAVIDRLEQNGHFYDPVAGQVEGEFVPWLLGAVANNLSRAAASREAVDALLMDAIASIQQAVSAKSAAAERIARDTAVEKAVFEAEHARMSELIEEERVRLEEEARVAEVLRVKREEEESARAQAEEEEAARREAAGETDETNTDDDTATETETEADLTDTATDES